MTAGPTQGFEIFGNYVLLKLLASGGMAEVFLARPANSSSNGRIVVVKRILRHIADNPDFIKMFHAEIRVTLGFNNPHTIQVHDFGEVDLQPYIAMEFIEGKTLKQIAQKFEEKREIIPVPTVLGLIAQAASGLQYAHSFENAVTGESVHAVHRDISPHNLIVSYDGNLKVIDFGVAKAQNAIGERTQTGLVKGKCGYLSPEQLRGMELDGRSDLFALGIVAWEMLTSQKLFQQPDDTELQVIKRIEKCDEYVRPPSQFNPEISPEVDAVVMRCLQKNPDDRYPNAGALQEALRQIMRSRYPNYNYSDASHIIRALFETEMNHERLELRKLNEDAQRVLDAQNDSRTKVLEMDREPSGLLGSVLGKFKKKHLPTSNEVRLQQLESALSRKATGKHFAVAALYLLAFIGLRIDAKYGLLDRYFDAEVAQASDIQPAAYKPKQVYRYYSSEQPVAAVKEASEPPNAVETPAALRPQFPSQPVKRVTRQMTPSRPVTPIRETKKVYRAATPKIKSTTRKPASASKAVKPSKSKTKSKARR